MGYDDRFYDRGVSRNNSQDAAALIANEIFHHDLQHAADQTRGILSQVSARDAQTFVNQVDQDIAALNRNSGQQYGDQSGNYLSARQTYDRSGRPVEHIDMVSADGYHRRGVTDVPVQPYARVPMNFNQYQAGEQPASGYYANQVPYNGFSTPGYVNPNYSSFAPVASNYNYESYQNVQPMPVPIPIPMGGYYGYHHRPFYAYGYGAGYGNYGYDNGVNTSIATGALIGGAIARAFRI